MPSVCAALTVAAIASNTSQAQPTRRAAVVFTLESDDADGQVRFEHVAAAIITKSGLIAIADDQAQRITVARQNGALVRVVGRSGEGPGEFKGLWSVGECAEGSIFAYDRMLQRATIIALGSANVRVTSITPAPTTMVCGPAGVVVLPNMPDLKAAPVGAGGRILYRGAVELRDSSMRRMALLPSVTLGEPRTLGQFTNFAVSGRRIAIATGDSAWVEVFDTAGKRTGAFPAGIRDRKPTVEQYAYAAEVLSASLTEAAQRRASIRLMLKQPMPERLPPYSAIFGAGDDGFWVVEGFGGDPTIRVARYSASLVRMFHMELPPRTRVLSGTKDLLLAVTADEDGREKLVGFSAR